MLRALLSFLDETCREWRDLNYINDNNNNKNDNEDNHHNNDNNNNNSGNNNANNHNNDTPGLHNKIPAHKIFARVWVAQDLFCSYVAAKIFQGLGLKRRESCNGDRV